MRTVQFVHRFLPLIFQQLTSSDTEIIEKASESLGHLAKVGGTLIAETIENQVATVIAWISAPESTDLFGGNH